MAGDLHNHSTFSDGSLKADLLPVLAARVGLTHLAISDHDTMRSVEYAYDGPVREGVQLIPATELTAFDFKRGRRVHLLCYWPDRDCPELIAHCDLMAKRRNEVGLLSAQELEALYPQLRTEDVLEKSRDSGVIYKSSIMQLLCDYGLSDGIYKETYRSLFGSKSGRVLHNPEYRSVDEVLEVIHRARGVAVFAHPSVYRSMELVRELVRDGRIDGIEVEHPRNTEEDKAELRKLALDSHLIITGGTDFHGFNTGTPHPLGTCRTAEDQIARIEALARSRKA